jgi:trans-aconitate methyltransferase
MPGGTLLICTGCDTVQKRIDERWHAETASIYRDYTLYSQSRAGSEQLIFDGGADARPRSMLLLDRLTDWLDFGTSKRMLDLGCGTGATLQAFHRLAPAWRLEGFDPNILDPGRISSLPGVAAVHSGIIDDLDGNLFDCITCIHTLEHIVDPLSVLSRVSEMLQDDGILLIQVPFFLDNPFDLVVADHCSHFTPATLASLLAAAGFEVLLCSTEVIFREITLIARRGARAPVAVARSDDAPQLRGEVTAAMDWLSGTLAMVQTLSRCPRFGVFGTSIAAAWLTQPLGERIDFYVEEDSSRIGGDFLGKPILAPDRLPPDAHVFIALTPKTAGAVTARLTHLDCHWHQPPSHDPTGTAKDSL